MPTERRIPESRLERLMHLGRLAGGIAGSALGEGARQLAQGRRPSVGDLLLTPANAHRLAERLSEMRGAAMKVGQLLSMEAGEFLPPELSRILERLRGDAHTMPLGQVAEVLNRTWGTGWERHFKRFSFSPLAAASIGQVHEAVTREGQHLAIKVQYPGVRRSIDSDVDNVAAMLSLVRLIPQEIDFAPLLAEAKRQLHQEADYEQEAALLNRFAGHLGDHPGFEVPRVLPELTTPEVLAMTFLGGRPIETLKDAPAVERNRVATTLLELALREVFEWGLVQTDPNFANYLYAAGDGDRGGRIQLLDFGATRDYPHASRTAFRDLLLAAISGDEAGIERAAIAVGYLGADNPPAYRAGMVEMVRDATEPARTKGGYHFGRSDLARRIGEKAMDLRLKERFGRLPPPAMLFLHRKLGGLYLLFSHLRAEIRVGDLMAPLLAGPVAGVGEVPLPRGA
jgi:predicted unusual protein kinase regulating ubiquinone biosynthesis (AarF/ABC1/UbiB family)